MKANDKRQLGRIDLDLTILGFGTVAMGNLFKSISEADANAIVMAARAHWFAEEDKKAAEQPAESEKPA